MCIFGSVHNLLYWVQKYQRKSNCCAINYRLWRWNTRPLQPGDGHTFHQVQHYKFCILSRRCLCVSHRILTNKTFFRGFRSSHVDAVSVWALPDVSNKRYRMDCWPLNMTEPRSFETSTTINPTAERLMRDPSAQHFRPANINHRNGYSPKHVQHSPTGLLCEAHDVPVCHDVIC